MSLERVHVESLFYPGQGENITRSGIIPYTRINNLETDEVEELWLLGTLPSGRLSDFGGGCNILEGELSYECIIREVDEESNGLLTDVVARSLDDAFVRGIEKDEDINDLIIWRWKSRQQKGKDTTNVDYLVFIPVDYEELAEIGEQFEGNEENTSINWYYAADLERESVMNFNTSIQKYLRKFGWKK